MQPILLKSSKEYRDEYNRIYRLKNKEWINVKASKNKEAKKEYDKKYRKKNKFKYQDYYIKNKEQINKQRHEYLLKNPEIRKKYNEIKRKHYRDNLVYYTDKSRKYKQQNKEVRNKKLSIRLKNDAEYRLKCNLRARISSALKGKGKSSKTMELIGCNLSQLKKHLANKFKKGMTFENHNYKGWHIDHIKPCASFDLRCPVQQLACFNYNNLQPLWASHNMSKGAKI